MSCTERIRPTRAAVVVAMIVGVMIGALALAGCGAGQVSQTSRQVADVNGASAEAASILVRNARIEFAGEVQGGDVYTRGASAPLRMSIVNTGADADRLVSATSPAASSVRISGDAEIPGGQVLVVDDEPPVPTTPAAIPRGDVGAQREGSIVLTGLRQDIRAGLTYPVVLTFARAGEIRLEVPVDNPSAPRKDEPAE
ncbi:MAG: copper chaperone PCu(A)C [Pseudonocardia sp.]